MGLRRPWYWAAGHELLYYVPASIINLHERAVVGKGANHQITFVVSPNSIISTLSSRNNANPEAPGSLKMILINLHRSTHPSIGVHSSQRATVLRECPVTRAVAERLT